MNTITPLTSSTNLGSATARPSSQLPWQKYIQSGEVLKAGVLEAQGKDLFVLDIKGNHIAAQSKAPLSVGQTLQLQVVTTSPQIELKIISNAQQPFFGHSLTLVAENIDLAGLFRTLQKTGPSPLEGLSKTAVPETKGRDVFTLDIEGTQATIQSKSPPSVGQTLQLQMVKATVLEAKGQGVFTLDMRGTRVAVQSEAPLSVGQTLQLQVVTTSSQIELKIVSESQQQPPGGSLTLIGENKDLLGLLKTLQPATGTSPFEDLSHTTRVSLENFFSLQQNQLSGKDGGEILKQLIDKMGLTLENLLAKGDQENAVKTLKAALLEIAHVFKDATEVANTTHRLLGTIEVYQLAQLHLDNAANFIFPLPLPFLEKGYLLVEDYGQKKERDENSIQPPMRFSLHLTMAELGNLRIDFLQYQDGLYIRFNTDSKEKSTFVESFSTDLQQAITNTPLLGLSFSDAATDPAAELIQTLLPRGSSMLDTKA
jgi:hypothetical protein